MEVFSKLDIDGVYRCSSPLPESIAERVRKQTYQPIVKHCRPRLFCFYMEQHIERLIQQYKERAQRAFQVCIFWPLLVACKHKTFPSPLDAISISKPLLFQPFEFFYVLQGAIHSYIFVCQQPFFILILLFFNLFIIKLLNLFIIKFFILIFYLLFRILLFIVLIIILIFFKIC